MATHLTIVNNVLLRLREDQVTSIVDTNYSSLIASIVGTSYREVSEQHDWQSLYHEVQIAVTSSKTVYDLSKKVSVGGDVANTSTRVCRPDSELEFSGDIPSIKLYDDSLDDSGFTPILVSPEAIEVLKSTDRDADEDDFTYITFYPTEDYQELRMEVWPIPTDNREVRIRFWTKPTDLVVNSSSDSTVIIIPDAPVFDLSLMYALNERGEEIGEPGNIAENRYLDSLAEAKFADIRIRQKTNRYDWGRD